MDGLSVFIDKTWEKIKTQKELNLPDQRQMVANYRCNELKEEAFLKVEDYIKELRFSCEKNLLPDFSQRCKEILLTSVGHYEEFAHQYEQTVYEKVKKELLFALLQALFLPFDIQLKMLRH
mmetsp:Transcript_45372/g.33151  ORF Transcript_45372/g.33151 Transcript_45372/m.33151 type:complete len:121 (-) Transcript_45372:1113-1475(-)